jgi:hypothetical protein
MKTLMREIETERNAAPSSLGAAIERMEGKAFVDPEKNLLARRAAPSGRYRQFHDADGRLPARGHRQRTDRSIIRIRSARLAHSRQACRSHVIVRCRDRSVRSLGGVICKLPNGAGLAGRTRDALGHRGRCCFLSMKQEKPGRMLAVARRLISNSAQRN